MRSGWWFAAGTLCGAAVIGTPKVAAHLHAAMHGVRGADSSGEEARMHTEEKFSFTANGTMSEVAPLFGAEKERVWAPGWNPQFVHPLPVTDEQGMVFTVKHEHLRASWVNTVFDPQNGRFQYVYMIPDALVTVISIQLTPQGNRTQVDVTYERTALSAEANAHVQHMAEGDRRAGPEWEQQINGYLAKVKR